MENNAHELGSENRLHKTTEPIHVVSTGEDQACIYREFPPPQCHLGGETMKIKDETVKIKGEKTNEKEEFKV
jgi:hypothetical protein